MAKGMTVEDVARVPTLKEAELLTKQLRGRFGGTWSISEREQGKGFRLRASGLGPTDLERAQWFVVGFLAGSCSEL